MTSKYHYKGNKIVYLNITFIKKMSYMKYQFAFPMVSIVIIGQVSAFRPFYGNR